MRSFTRSIPFWLLSLSVLARPVSAKTVRYDFRDAGLRNLVYFVSEGALQKTVALSHAAAGWIELDPERVSDGLEGELEVDVRTFDSLSDAVNSEMRKLVGSAEYSFARFVPSKVTSASKSALTEGQPVTLKVEGSLTLKGVTKPESLILKLTSFKESEGTRAERLPGNLLKVDASFELDLAKYDLAVPDERRLQFSRYLSVFFNATGTDLSPTTQLASPAAVAMPTQSDRKKKQK